MHNLGWHRLQYVSTSSQNKIQVKQFMLKSVIPITTPRWQHCICGERLVSVSASFPPCINNKDSTGASTQGPQQPCFISPPSQRLLRLQCFSFTINCHSCLHLQVSGWRGRSGSDQIGQRVLLTQQGAKDENPRGRSVIRNKKQLRVAYSFHTWYLFASERANIEWSRATRSVYVGKRWALKDGYSLCNLSSNFILCYDLQVFPLLVSPFHPRVHLFIRRLKGGWLLPILAKDPWKGLQQSCCTTQGEGECVLRGRLTVSPPPAALGRGNKPFIAISEYWSSWRLVKYLKNNYLFQQWRMIYGESKKICPLAKLWDRNTWNAVWFIIQRNAAAVPLIGCQSQWRS